VWIKMKCNDAELDCPGFESQRFIDNDEAVAIKTPRPKEAVAPVPTPIPSLVMVPVSAEVRKIVQDLGLSNQPQSYAFIQRFLDLEKYVNQMDTFYGNRANDVIRRVVTLEAAAKNSKEKTK
jgi:hypothetical protein